VWTKPSEETVDEEKQRKARPVNKKTGNESAFKEDEEMIYDDGN
jgi:hypothetical protein